MVETQSKEIIGILEDLRSQFAALSERVARLEKGGASLAPQAPAAVAAAPEVAAAAPEALPPPRAQISEQELLAVSAALAAYLGVRVHIRQIRLISSRAWAQEGRVSIQASHRLYT